MFIHLKTIRETLNLSQGELAKRLVVSTGLISHWESGFRIPSEEYQFKIAQALGVSLDYLLNGDQAPIFKFRAKATLSAPQVDEVDAVRRDASQLVYFVTSVQQMANKPPRPFSLSAEFSFEDAPRLVNQIKDAMRLNKRISLDELKQALSEMNIFVFEWNMPLHMSGLSYRGNTTVIIVNNNHTKERKLFTLSHEFAHVLFHLGGSKSTTEVSVIASNRDPLEKQANYFATELIMPSSEIESVVQKWGKADLKKPHVLNFVAQSFNVSIDALFYRLANTGIFEWAEKGKFLPEWRQTVTTTGDRVKQVYNDVSLRYLELVISLYCAGRATPGKVAEWLFASKEEVEGVLEVKGEKLGDGLVTDD